MATMLKSSVGESTSQSAKVILSQLYVNWATDPEGINYIRGTIQELLATAKTSTSSHITINTITESGSGVGSSNTNRYADPSAALGGHSHPPSVRKDGTTASTSTSRIVDLNEWDRSHRGGSPGVIQPAVDRMAPLPHVTTSPGGTVTSAASLSPPGVHRASAAEVTMDIMPTVDASVALAAAMARDTVSRGMVREAGSSALMPPPNVQRASLWEIPVFYTSKESMGVVKEADAAELEKLTGLLEREGGKPISTAQYEDISVYVFKVPRWLLNALFVANVTFLGAPLTTETLTAAQITRFYQEKMALLSPSRRLFELIRGNSSENYISMADLQAMARHLVSSHPGLEFLQQPEFQDYYCHTVAIRIMYALECQQCGRIYWRDFDRSDLPDVMVELDVKDVNLSLEYFSYEHFYVLYCKFWELDTDRDFKVDYNDLLNYGQGSVVPAVIRRVVDGCGRRLSSGERGHLAYEDFVYFCLSEEDKNSEPAVLYWFKILDVDEDGILSGYELSEFYRENEQRFLEYTEGEVSYADTMCQMLDMLGFDRIKLRRYGVSLGDLRACPTPANFFNMIFNAPKFMMFEHRDPFSEHQQKMRAEKTDWDRFARAEYDRMAAEAQ